MSDIFICYSRKDSALAARLKQRLQAEGWTVFMDEHIDAGHRWAEEITNQLAVAQAVLTLWSKNSINSRFVMDEAHEAADRRIIFPARIEEVPIPYGFRQFQTPDLIGWDGNTEIEQWQLLVSSLRKHLMLASLVVNQDASKQNPIGHQYTPSFLAPGQTFRDSLKISGEGPLMVVIPAGRFLMGSPPDEPERRDSEGPQHEVRIARPFALGITAVTFDDFDIFCQVTNREQPADEGWERKNRPVINVSWHDAQDYCFWLSGQTSRSFRLPSEAEWEYACRAGTSTPFHTGTRINTEQANFDGTRIYNGSTSGKYREKTVAVGTFPPNAFGLYDMHGDVWEWCQDKWHDYYQGAPSDGSSWEDEKVKARVLRGGSCRFGPDDVRSSARHHGDPDARISLFGFRVFCSLPIE
ncbi:MAG: SUMF1/EgtB/PvdO family nonheme iron enzyme [Nitrosomonas sp.]|nr:SUMF1/EgtB/PvdO family nonheme iron enzyme [Nitrosomonas sp.]